MEGSHQKGKNWYRCRFVYHRGAIAADAAGHPRTIGIKGEKILPELPDFMGRRLFGPDRLQLLRAELAKSAAADWQEHDNQEAKLQREAEQLQRSIYRQTLRLEEHDDPNHPVIAAASRRIEELSSRYAAVEDAIKAIKSQQPSSAHPDDILAMLDAIPDLRPILHDAEPHELADIYKAFQINAIYDKPNRTLELSAIVRPDLLTKDETQTGETTDRSGYSYIAGERFAPMGDLSAPIERVVPWPCT
jgi:hypothetical protein